ncbi:hypothetical protein [Paenibacillus sp. RC84]|uniref:hypothetical protein n=1 Tax=Paenibacillus sp. RC84 TaxID=3156252 RepID=UPI003518EA42
MSNWAAIILKKLTDVYSKRPDSNIGKIIGILAGQMQDLEDTFGRIGEWRDIDNAEGTTLDMIGETVVQPRGKANDAIYRIMIKAKIARNLSNADINSIISVIALALNSDPKEVTIKEMWDDPITPEPAAISMMKIPIDRLNEIGMDPRQFARIVQKTVASGVRVSVIELMGTFEFADADEVQVDEDRGFSDIEGKKGGYLGSAFVPSESDDLPI